MTKDFPQLGSVREIDLPAGRLRYHDIGDGPTIVFVHGLLTNSTLWRHVAPRLAEAGFRCLTPDWPLGSHEIPMPDAELTPPGVADLITSFLDALDLADVTVVANDTGGAITQVLMSRNHERVGRVVLTPSDSYDMFFPPIFRYLPPLIRIPGAVQLLGLLMGLRWVYRLPIAFGLATKRRIPREAVDSYRRPVHRQAAIRNDLRRFLSTVHKRHTLAAAETFPEFTKPVLVAWAREDRLFPMSLAERLATDLPNATLRTIDESYTFISEDRPELLADLILEFTRLHAPS